ncbi:hypothetical protein IWQ60_006308 [Tieghemiomyces parasiticus]|uniref:Uncharacterized protein n=1 Tax=Tieghemiomyces parasiticus TaxID=78921 RepID=A0A9W8AD96_9FUNG|nr:hypothetical protein IWQ60_006308 [Tieghemiomyces parasiticus]
MSNDHKHADVDSPKGRRKRTKLMRLKPASRSVSTATIEQRWVPMPPALLTQVQYMLDASMSIIADLSEAKVPRMAKDHEMSSIKYEDLEDCVRSHETSLLHDLDYLYALEVQSENQEKTINQLTSEVHSLTEHCVTEGVFHSQDLAEVPSVEEMSKHSVELGLDSDSVYQARQVLSLAASSGYEPHQDDGLQNVQVALCQGLVRFLHHADETEEFYRKLELVRHRLAHLMDRLGVQIP